MRTTKEDLKEASGRGDREDWFEDQGCLKSSAVAKWHAKNSRRNGVNSAKSIKGTKLCRN